MTTIPPRHCKILVVDDEPLIRTFIARVLERASYRVMQAGDGVEALEMLDADPVGIDMVVSDVVMPRMPGPALAAAIRLRFPGVPVLLVSAFADGREDPEANTFLAKPFTAVELHHAVRQLLDRAGHCPIE